MKKMILLVIVLMAICPIFAQEIAVKGTLTRFLDEDKEDSSLVLIGNQKVSIHVHNYGHTNQLAQIYEVLVDANGYYELLLSQAEIEQIAKIEVFHTYIWDGKATTLHKTEDPYIKYPTVDFVYGQPIQED